MHWTYYDESTKNIPRSLLGYIYKLPFFVRRNQLHKRANTLLHQLSLAKKIAGNSFIQKDQLYLFSVLEGTVLKYSVLLVYCLHIYYFSNYSKGMTMKQYPQCLPLGLGKATSILRWTDYRAILFVSEASLTNSRLAFFFIKHNF